MREFKVLLWEPDGKRHQWTVATGDTPLNEKGEHDYANYDFARRTITVFWRLRNLEVILDTLLHEGTHVAHGVNADEHLVEAVEENYVALRKGWNGQS